MSEAIEKNDRLVADIKAILGKHNVVNGRNNAGPCTFVELTKGGFYVIQETDPDQEGVVISTLFSLNPDGSVIKQTTTKQKRWVDEEGLNRSETLENLPVTIRPDDVSVGFKSEEKKVS